MQPFQVRLGPGGLGLRVYQPMPQAEGKDLLLRSLQVCLDVVPHADVFLHLLVFFRGNMHRTVGVVSQTLCDVLRVPLVSLHALLALLFHHGRRSEDHAFQPAALQLMIQRVAQASRFVSADEFCFFTVQLP